MEWPNAFAAAITFDMDADSLIHAADPEGLRRAGRLRAGSFASHQEHQR